MINVINLFVTCTQRKSREISSELRFRFLPAYETLEDLSVAWIDRLQERKGELVHASELYAGDHWQVVRSIKNATNNSPLDLRIWVISAGYGLISYDAPLQPYAATFSVRNPDSILSHCPLTKAKQMRAEWWRLLAEWTGPEPHKPRSFVQVIGQDPEAFLLIVASNTYLEAIAPDLTQVVQRHPAHKIGIISAGVPQKGWLRPYLLPCDLRLRSVLGGSCHSLNVRMARWVLQECGGQPLNFAKMREWLPRFLEGEKKPELPQRKPMNDSSVIDFIYKKIKRNPAIKPTPLLTEFRKSGYACEQHRFLSLFMTAREEFINNG